MVIDSIGELGGVLRQYKPMVRDRLDTAARRLHALTEREKLSTREIKERIEAELRFFVPLEIGSAVAMLVAMPSDWTSWVISHPRPDNEHVIIWAARSAVEHALTLAIEGDGTIPWPKEDVHAR